MSDIYNKNAREKALLEEAYSNIYNEGVNYGDTSGGAQRRLTKHNKQLKKSGAVRLELKGPKGTSRATLPKGDPKIEELEKQGYKRIEIEDGESMQNFRAGAGKAAVDIGKGVGRLGIAAGGAGAKLAGMGLGGVLQALNYLTAEQLKRVGDAAMELAAENEEENEAEGRKFEEGQIVMGKSGMEYISNIDEQGEITTYKMEEGHYYKPGTEEYEELDDYDEYVKYDRMSTYRPAYGEY